MIKRWFTFLLLEVCLLIAIPLVAYADVLIEPNNDFYTRHRNKCTSLNRSFYANGESGSVSLKKEPGSQNETAAIENGEILNIMFTYNYKGEIWGVTEIYTANKSYDKWPTGWIPMNQLLLVYDYISFAEDHQDEFHTYIGNYETLKTAEKIVLWSWSGSGIISETIDTSGMNDIFTISDAYTDEQNRDWGFIGYWYGRRNTWVCISDPVNGEISAINPAPQSELWQPSNTIPQSGLSTPVLIVILVVFVVVGTAVLIRILWKPDKGDSY